MLGLDTETENGRAIVVGIADATGNVHRSLDVSRDHPRDAVRAIVGFLVTDPPAQYVGWNSDYDARAILAYAPRRWLELLVRTGRETWPGTSWRVTYYPGKLLEIRNGQGGFALYDAMQFFGGSLRKAASIVGLKKGEPGVPWDQIGPAMRSGGDAARQIVRYCESDAQICAALWQYCDRALRALRVDTTRPLSPAHLAARYFIPNPKSIRPAAYAQDVGEQAYYGGRSEVFQRGRFRNVRYYDIHSAYPWALSKMPAWDTLQPTRDLEHAVMAIVTADLDIPRDVPMGPVPVRDGGVLLYPVGRICRYTMDLHTFRMLARSRWIAKIRRVYAWAPDPYVAPRPQFPQIPRLYRLKESGPAMRLAAKLMLNGVSGKLAELREDFAEVSWPGGDVVLSDGTMLCRNLSCASRTNFVMAAHCTGAVRARLYDTMMMAPDRIISCATDGIFARGDLPLTCGPGMGQWGRDIIPDHIQIACGIYLHGPMQTIRGFSAKEPILPLLRAHPRADRIAVTCGLPSTLLYSLRSGEQINLIGTWKRELRLNCDTKRKWPRIITCEDLLATRRAQTSAPLALEELHGPQKRSPRTRTRRGRTRTARHSSHRRKRGCRPVAGRVAKTPTARTPQ